MKNKYKKSIKKLVNKRNNLYKIKKLKTMQKEYYNINYKLALLKLNGHSDYIKKIENKYSKIYIAKK